MKYVPFLCVSVSPGTGRRLRASCSDRRRAPSWDVRGWPGRCCRQPAERNEEKAPAQC